MNREPAETEGVPAGQRELTAGTKLDVLLEVARRSRGTLDLGETLDHLLDAVATVLDYDAAGIFALNEDLYPSHERPQGMIAGVARRGFPTRPVEEDAMLSSGRGLVGHAIRSGRSVLVRDVREDPRYIEGRPGTLSEIAVPIAVDGRTIAALDVESDRLAAYDERDVERLEFFAEAAALAIEKAMLHHHLLEKEQLELQIRIAREVQLGLLPQAAPEIPGYAVAGLCLPSLQLGGDYFDYLPFAGGRVGFAIADVAGKGVPAALIMATFRALLRAQADAEARLAETAAGVSRLLRGSAATRAFVTCSYAVLDPETGGLAYTNCGHPPPLHLHADGRSEELANCGPVLGVFPDATFEERRTELAPGDRLLFYTDGLVEARNPAGEELGLERLKREVAARRALDASALTRELVALARGWVGARNLADDLTLIVLDRLAPAPSGPTR